MTNSIFMYVWRQRFCLAILLLFLAGCLPSNEDFASQSPLLAALERKTGLIAYVGSDGNIYTIDQGGGSAQAVTSDSVLPAEGDPEAASQIYMYPTWSHDSSALAFVRLQGEGNRAIASAIFSAQPDGSGFTELYSSTFAQPIYLSWAPDNEKLSFLAATTSGSYLLQMVPAGGGEARLLDAGQPLFWSWAPDGDHVLVHAGGSGSSARLAFLTPQETIVEELLEVRPAPFQAPSWSRIDDQIVLYGMDEQGEPVLMLVSSDGSEERRLASPEGPGPTSFARSPDGSKLAYIETESEAALGAQGKLTVLDLKRSAESLATAAEEVIAFFWSPDSKKLAYFVPRAASLGSGNAESDTIWLLELFILEPGRGKDLSIYRFLPTAELLGILPLFDQYHQSATIWSPDSKNLVLTAFTAQNQPSVLVINASGDLEPRIIASGLLAFWSWE